SESCPETMSPFATCCQECDKIPARIAKLADIATHAEKGTNYQYLSHQQLEDLVVQRTKEMNTLKPHFSLNMSRQLATFARKMGDYERLVMAIAENDVPRVNALLSTAVSRSFW
ncbi:hypothetical protein R3P38DRAFT_2565994, partial [Favolaschia claudopus]